MVMPRLTTPSENMTGNLNSTPAMPFGTLSKRSLPFCLDLTLKEASSVLTTAMLPSANPCQIASMSTFFLKGGLIM